MNENMQKDFEQELKNNNQKMIEKMQAKISILEIAKSLSYEQWREIKNLLKTL